MRLRALSYFKREIEDFLLRGTHVLFVSAIWSSCIALIFFLPVAGAAESSPLPPRMWKAVKVQNGQPTTLYILGTTHFGLPAEYDKYFDEKVVPAFKSAEIFYYEGAGGREDEPKPLCQSTDLDDEKKKRLIGARERAIEYWIELNEIIEARLNEAGHSTGTTKEQRHKTAMLFINSLDEFELINNIQTSTVNLADFKSTATSESVSHVGEPVVDALRRVAKSVPIKDLDSKYGARRAYCTAGGERINYLEGTLNPHHSQSASLLKLLPIYQQEFSLILQGERLPLGSLTNQLAPIDKTFICGRNKEWLTEIQKLAAGKVHFYAMGGQHLFGVDHRYAQCDGIIPDLKRNGWSLSRVEL